MKDMKDAPLDGTRILILHTPMRYSNQTGQYVPVGEKWEEGWWFSDSRGGKPHWQPWEGSYRSRSTGHLCNPKGWMDLPENNS